MTSTVEEILATGDYRLVVDDRFDGDDLDRALWLPHHLPQWSSRSASAARYDLDDDALALRIDADQRPWCPEFDGDIRVSSLQTGVYSGEPGTHVGQHRFSPDVVVREHQALTRLFTPQFGLFVLRASAPLDDACMAALWMIGFEDHPDRSGVIDVFEIFGKDATPQRATITMNVKAFGDPALRDDLGSVDVDIDVREFHDYAVEWTDDSVTFFVDGQPLRRIDQSPQYPMQFMLGLYEFDHDDDPAAYPRRFVVDCFRAYAPVTR